LAGLVVVFEMSFLDTGKITVISAVSLSHVVKNGVTTIRATSVVQQIVILILSIVIVAIIVTARSRSRAGIITKFSVPFVTIFMRQPTS